MPFVITDACVDTKDRTCIEECPIDCIYEGRRRLYINPEECIDCGACEPVCPVEAIYSDRQVPQESLMFIDDNARFFTEVLPGRDEPLGAPGGAAGIGALDVDTVFTSAWVTEPAG